MTQEVVPVNMEALQRAASESSGPSSPLSQISRLKIYNPEPGKTADPEKDGKFVLLLAHNGGEAVVEGPIKFIPLDIVINYSGSIYPINEETGLRSDDKVFFYSNEFSRFSKKDEVIGLAAKGQVVGYFKKGDFEKMIKTPILNGRPNHFFEEKKNAEGKPYASSALARKVIVYGQISEGEYEDLLFYMVINPGQFGITFKDGKPCEAEPGTLEASFKDALPEFNALMASAKLKTVNNVPTDQIDVEFNIVQNERGNNLPHFSYAGLVAKRGVDSYEAREAIRQVRKEAFEHNFKSIGLPFEFQDDNGKLTMLGQMNPVKLDAPKEEVQTSIVAEDAEAVFGEEVKTFDEPSHESIKKADF